MELPTTQELKKQSTRPPRPVRQADEENPQQGGGPCRQGQLTELTKHGTMRVEWAGQGGAD